MSLSPAFTVTQTLSNPRRLTLVDTTIGSDSAVVTRRVLLQKSDGTYIKPTGITTDYILWSLADAIIDIDVLDRDYALFIVLQFVNSGGSVVAQTSNVFDFRMYAKQFFIALTKRQTSNPSVIYHNDYYLNKLKLLLSIEESKTMTEDAIDIYSAQAALERAKKYADNEKILF